MHIILAQLIETLKSSAAVLLVLLCAVVITAITHQDPPDATA